MASSSKDSALPLGETCTICHGIPKYTCPRCSARTCSLPCVQVHKSRTLCSGVRNPGAYLKRHELATEKAFDQDFNFIAGLERRLESSERDLDVRGVSIHVDGQREKKGIGKGEVPIKRVLEESQVSVSKVPSGLERARKNETRWLPRTKTVLWTVEWLHAGERGYASARDTVSVTESWKSYLRMQGKGAEKAQMGNKTEGVEKQAVLQVEDTAADTEDAQESTKAEANHDAKDAEEANPEDDKFNFLLHVPGTSRGRMKAVISLDTKKPLREALRGNNLLEFPTIEATDIALEELDPALYAVYRHPWDLGRSELRVNSNVGAQKRPAEELETKAESDKEVKVAKIGDT